jgi:hypothetical protein
MYTKIIISIDIFNTACYAGLGDRGREAGRRKKTGVVVGNFGATQDMFPPSLEAQDGEITMGSRCAR